MVPSDQLGVFNSSSLTVRVPSGECKVLRTSTATNLVGQCSGLLPKYVAMFDGQSSYINTGAITWSSTQTISYWVYKTNAANAGYFATTSAKPELYSNGASGLQLYWAGSAGLPLSGQYTNAYSLNLNQWYFVTLTSTSTSLNMYLNGVLIESDTSLTLPVSSTTAAYFGCYAGGGSNYLSGEMSNIQLYNATLDQSQIQSLYLEGIGGAPVSPQYLVGWWPLNGDTNDYSGKNSNGVPTGITYTSQYGK